MQPTDVREAARGAVDQSKSFIGRQVDDRTTQLGRQIEGVADDLRNVAGQLRGNDALGFAASYVDQGADLMQRLGRYLESADGQQLYADAESLARRQPWALASGALVLGFAASRFLKTSSARRYQSTYGESPFDTYSETSSLSATYRGIADDPAATGIRSGGERYAT